MLARRLCIVTAVVVAWMGLGWSLHTDPDGYLLLGIPLTLAFQLVAARKPLIALWHFGDALPGRKQPWLWAFAGFAVVPLRYLATGDAMLASQRAWYFLSAVGLVIAAWVFASGRTAPRAAWGLSLLAALSGTLPFLIAAWQGHAAVTSVGPAVVAAQLVMYFGVCFILEEVSFRGAFDPYVARGAVGMRNQWLSAIWISFLWGAWHFPILFATPTESLSTTAVQVLLFHTGLGCVLSFTARLAGILSPCAFAHALIDSARNAMR